MKKYLRIIGWIIVFSIVGMGCNAYLIVKYNPTSGETFDGFGRQLTDSPWFMRIIFSEDKEWVGWKWFFLDIIIFWGSIGIGMHLIKIGED